MQTLYPVILGVPEPDRNLRGKAKATALSRHARRALEVSVRKSGLDLTRLLKDAAGAPLPANGNHWSLSHKSRYVAAVVAPARIGIDIEQIRPCAPALLKKTVRDSEWDLSDQDRQTLFFRYWTSKESVLKAAGSGINALAECRIVQVIDDHNLVVDYRQQRWRIEHTFCNGHVASVVKNGFQVRWTVIDNGAANDHEAIAAGGRPVSTT